MEERKITMRITGKMQEDGRSACKQIPRSAVSNGQAPTINVHRTGSVPASMRKFAEYPFLKDSRYARQAKSERAFPWARRRALAGFGRGLPRRCRGLAGGPRN